jgi:hypothetical protein
MFFKADPCNTVVSPLGRFLVEHHVVGGIVGIFCTTLIVNRVFTVGIIHGRACLCGEVNLGDGTLLCDLLD